MFSDTLVGVRSHELRATRRDAGLSASTVARAAGTSVPNLSAYERGAKRPSAATLHRLLSAIRCGADSPIHRYQLLTVPAAVALLRRALAEGWPTGDLLRIVRELRSNATHLRSGADVSAFLARPSTTGDERWDALIAGVVAMEALEREGKEPPWTRMKSLPYMWFVGSMPALDGDALAHTPPSLLVRGVVVDRRDLESV